MAEARIHMIQINAHRPVAAPPLAAARRLLGRHRASSVAKVAEIKSRPGGRIEPLPEVKPYETYSYAASDLRSPFDPGHAGVGERPERRAPRRQPSARVPRAVLARHAADGRTLRLQGRTYGLVQTQDGLVHRVLPGNHVGQSDGRISAIQEGKISLIEIVTGRHGRLHRASRCIGAERMICKEIRA